MPTNTYVVLDKITTTGSVPSVTFTSIPSGYTDLVIIGSAQQVTLGEDLALQFNSDTGTNYSRTYLCGDGGTAHSGRSSNVNQIILDHHATPPTGTSFSTAIINIMNYANTNTFKSVINRTGAIDTNPGLGTVANVGLWRSTSAITSVKIFCTNGSDLKTGSTFSLYGIQGTAVSTGTAKASGGTITYDSFGYVYHTFTSGGTFTPSQSLSCDLLVVGGGGGGGQGGSGGYGGGGGAGGYRTATSQSLTAIGYSVTVGGAGSGGVSNTNATSGTGSSFASILASAGGGNGGGYNNTAYYAGGSGGSGGGGPASAGAGNTPATSPSQGNNGGAGSGGSAPRTGGGGGGATTVGTFGTYNGQNPSSNPGDGGTGSNSLAHWAIVTSTGVNGYYAGGGGGGHEGGSGGGIGGAGGGGNSGGGGTANTGGGGGGGNSGNGANGGSGIVIVRYYGA
jgi:hypothetical protein